MVRDEAHARAPHAAVATRFRHFLEACALDRSQFVAGVDGAIDARTLYPILNGTRRPSRALAVLIERTWGFRADYLLDGIEPAWGTPAVDAAEPPGPVTDFERELLAFVRRSLDNVHSMRLDLERGLQWERLFARTERLLETLDATTGDDGSHAAAIGMVFDDCLRAAAAFERFTVAIQRRRALQLTLAYFDWHLAGGTGGAGASTQRRGARRRARAALAASEAEVADCRERIEAILALPNPVTLLSAPAAEADETLAAIVGSAIP
jgi:hypothetical protein